MVYLDNSASTQAKFFAKDYAQYYFNTNMPYAHTENAKLEEARNRIKACLGVKSGKVIFTRCSTEAVEWLTNRLDGFHFCSHYEHDSTYVACHCLDFNPDELKEDHNFRAYMHQYVNQMTGKVFPVRDIEKQIHRLDQGYSFFCVDATASIGKVKMLPNMDSFCDCIWASSHKFHGEKGIGFLWLSDRLFDYLGGKADSRNNYGLLHGTLALPSILAMTDALEYTTSHLEASLEHYRELHEYMYHYAQNKGLYIYEKVKDSCAAINAITIPHCNADALCNWLWSKGIYVGKGASACAEEKDYRVLEAFGYTQEQAEQTIRVSFSPENTLEDVEKLIEAIIEFKEKF